MGSTSTALVWLLTRALVLWLFFGPHDWVTGDVAYFAESLSRMPERGLRVTLVEYPLPGVALVAFPWLLSQWLARPDLYAETVLVLAVVTDAAFTLLLRRSAGGGGTAGVGVWLLAVPLLGATTYARFDVVPGILAGAALLLLVAHPRLAAAAGAVATGLKLWPALLLPALAARRRERRDVVAVVVGLGVLLVTVSLVLAGWTRLLSPLTWQSDRGLQIESVLATPAMLAWAVRPGQHVVAYSDYNAFEVSGPTVPLLLAGTTLLTVLMVLGLAALWVVAWRRGRSLGRDAVVWSCLTAVTAFTVSSRVLSPQYLLWLLPLAAAGLAVVHTPRGVARMRGWALTLLVVTAATQLVFPVFYGSLVRHDDGSVWVVLLLAVRNLALVLLLVLAAREAWWHLEDRARPEAQRGIELERQPPGPEGSAARSLR
jgi:hypothetical protein